MSILRRARCFGRPAAGDGLILTTTCTSSATPSASSLLTRPETGRGDASLWTAAAAPDHRLWTTLRGPLDPSRLPTSPPPTTAVACRQRAINQNQSKEDDRPYSGSVSPSRQRSLSQALTGGPYLSIEVGRTGLSKAIPLPRFPKPGCGSSFASISGHIAACSRPSRSRMASRARWRHSGTDVTKVQFGGEWSAQI
jgi:hypothetical protein